MWGGEAQQLSEGRMRMRPDPSCNDHDGHKKKKKQNNSKPRRYHCHRFTMNALLSRLCTPSMPQVAGAVAGWCRTLVTCPQLPHALAGTPTPVFGGVTPLGRRLLQPPTLLGGVSGRTNIRCHFPRPSEIKRIRRHGWEQRMSTRNGREVLRRRVLKGRHVLAH